MHNNFSDTFFDMLNLSFFGFSFILLIKISEAILY